jgi:hypothetical protein
MRISRRFAFMSIAAALAAPGAGVAAERQRLKVVVAVGSGGLPTRAWLDALRDRVTSDQLSAIAAHAKPLTPDERAWAELIGRRAPEWFAGIARLNAPFRILPPPPTVRVVLGNQGGDDAFGVAPDTAAFDLSSLASVYGVADPEANGRLMGRLLSHEYTHLLINPYLERIGWSEAWASTAPFLRALRTLYNEGLGNLRSLEGDPRFVSPTGAPTPRAREALTQLQPVMLQRLQRLRADPPPEEARMLLRNISEGPFTGKWGALPIALWLAADTGFAPAKIAAWVEGGPQGILALAVRQADAAFRPAFQELLAGAPAAVAAHRRA